MRHNVNLKRALGIVGGLLLVTVPVACSPSSDPPSAVRVVATTTVVADLVSNVGGDRVVVQSLVPAGGEPHTFDPRPSDVTAFAGADLVIMNGLGLDEWVVDLISEAGSEAPVVELAEDLPGVEYVEEEHEEEGEGGEGHEHGAVNPHLWLNVAYAQAYVTRIAEALAEVDAEGADGYHTRAATYNEELAELDAYARDELGAIPADQRRVVSFHEAFPYFAAAYGLDVIGTVVEAPGQDPSAGEVAALIDEMADVGVSAILSEDQFPAELVEQLASEAGVEVVADLYTDSLGDPPGDTFVGMIRHDVDRIVAALR
jgi:zinc/manganese transport system substrate-binding protein/manganese/iron transport system substrate-binding protein